MTELLRWHGKLQYDVPLARYTSWRVGGGAKCVYQPSDVIDLHYFLADLPHDETVLWLGLGSNTLIRDQGLNATVILTLGGLKTLEQVDSHIIRAEAGVSCATLARFSARQGLGGLAFLAGVPGTVGGALRMNAGAHGGETWDYVMCVETIDKQGQVHIRYPDAYNIQYRSVELNNANSAEWFVAAYFKLPHCEVHDAQQAIKDLLARRAATQPINEYTCGSVFRNPPGDYAARLIEACNLKGVAIGDAYVSPKHANFIVNRGHASAYDIEQLIQHVAQQVKQKFDIELHREVHIIGGT
ncbi:MAG: UDP-N-acetylmuramate dehydrogenase [Gammaproteobacteria bacterium]